MTKFFPIIQHHHVDQPLAYRGGLAISAARFVADVRALARSLPEHRYVINLCGDRYQFAVGLSAALLRGQISLLPPNHTPALIADLKVDYADLYGLTDSALNEINLETFSFPELQVTEMGDFAVPNVSAEQVVAHVFTSGSTGKPLPQIKTWGGLARGAAAQAERLAIAMHSATTLVGTVPAQHMYGLESSLILALQNGLSFYVGRPFYPEDIRAALAGLPGDRVLVTTPFHLRALLSSEQPLPQLARLLCATAPLPLELAKLAETRLNVELQEVYGFTEAGQVATRRTVDGPVWHTYRDVRVYERGDAYYAHGGTVEREAKFQDLIEFIDAEHFTLQGRSADLINIAGKRTSLANLNYHLNAIAGVTDGMFYLPDEQPDRVTRLMAFVVAPGMTQYALSAALRLRLDAAFLPRPIYFLDALPRNATGKLPRETLEALVLRLRGE